MFPLAILVAAIVHPIVDKLAQMQRDKWVDQLPHNVRTQVTAIVERAVLAIEQKMPNATGPEKKAACVVLVNVLLAAAGLGVLDPLVDTVIESTVFNMNLAKGMTGGAIARAALKWQAAPSTPTGDGQS